ncbi:hypothetical protein, partial [Enterococcus faecalis]
MVGVAEGSRGRQISTEKPCLGEKETKGSKRNRIIKNHVKMENIQRVWILYAILLSLNCLIAEERVTAAKI